MNVLNEKSIPASKIEVSWAMGALFQTRFLLGSYRFLALAAAKIGSLSVLFWFGLFEHFVIGFFLPPAVAYFFLLRAICTHVRLIQHTSLTFI